MEEVIAYFESVVPQTRIFEACCKGDFDRVKMLHNAGGVLTPSCYYFAILGGNFEIVKFLTEKNCEAKNSVVAFCACQKNVTSDMFEWMCQHVIKFDKDASDPITEYGSEQFRAIYDKYSNPPIPPTK